MKHFRREKSFLFAALLLASGILSACGSEGGNDSPSQTQPSESKTEASQDDVTKMTCFINHTWFPVDNFEGIIPDTITEKTGVTLDIIRAVDDKQLGLMIASGDLPELVYSSKELDRLSDPDLVYPYNELIEQYCPDWQVDRMSVTNASSYSGDANYYFLLNAFSPASEWEEWPGIPQIPTLAYRADILEELGNPPMETLDDFVTILGMVKENYPDKIPLATSSAWRMSAFRAWMGGLYTDYKETDDGTVVYYIDHPDYKKFCQFINNLYRQGYINADNFSISEPDSKAILQNAQCFAFSGYSLGEMYQFGEMSKSVEPNARIMESKPLTENAKFYNAGIGWSGMAITKNCKDPEKAIKMVEYMYSDEGKKLGQWGREGIEWTEGADGYPVFSEEWLEASRGTELNTKYNPNYFFGTSQAIEATGRIAVLPEEYRAVYEEFRPLIEHCPWMTYAAPKGDTEEKTIQTKLLDLVDGSEVKVFLSATEEEFESNFEEYMGNAKKIGIEQLNAYMTEHVASAKAIYQK